MARRFILWIDPRKYDMRIRSFGVYHKLRILSARHSLYCIVKEFTHELQDSSVRQATILCARRNFILVALIRSLALWYGNDRSKPDVIYTFSNYGMFIGWLLKILLSVKWVLDLGEHPEYQKMFHKACGGNPIKKMYYEVKSILLWRAVKYANLIIIQGKDLSSGLAERLMELNIPVSKLIAVPLGVDFNDLACVQSATNEERCRNELRVIYAGHLSRWRGIDNLIRAIKIVKETGVKVRLLLVGDFSNSIEKCELLQLVKNLDLTQEITFTGYVPHQICLNMIAGSDVCVCPFPKNAVFDQSFSLKIPEYLALGKATVATNLASTRAYIQDRVNGLLIPCNSPDDLAKAIVELHGNVQLRSQLEANARNSVAEYSWEAIVEKIARKIAEV